MRIVIPLIFGIVGTAVLVSLGIWQLQRLNWKESVIAQIDARIGDAPVALPATATEAADEYLPVQVAGSFTDSEIDVLTSLKGIGPGYRVIAAFQTEDGRRILVDRGFILQTDKAAARPSIEAVITGNLLWPDETDGFTPDPDLTANIWFARNLPAMAANLKTEEILVVARTTTETDSPVTPLPVDSAGIANNHLEYVVTWFGLAVVWVLMTGYFLWRQRRPVIQRP
jgi:surfeit locus 1 family protein